jgi:hypothetical protein
LTWTQIVEQRGPGDGNVATAIGSEQARRIAALSGADGPAGGFVACGRAPRTIEGGAAAG